MMDVRETNETNTDLRAHGDLLVAGVHGDPHSVLGRHGAQVLSLIHI